MDNLQHILQLVFRKESLDEVSVEELEQLSNEHPLFAPLHFLLAKKYRQTGNELYEKQLRKTALHFHNPLWLHYHISEKISNGHAYNVRDISSPLATIDLPATEPASSSHDLIEEVTVHQELEPAITANTPGASFETSEPVESVTAATDDAHVGEMYNTNTESEALKLAETEAKKELREENDRASAIDTETFIQPAQETQPDAGNQPDVSSSPETEESKQPAHPVAHHPLFSKGTDEDNGDVKPTFEPFHTVDYFASQGIKVGQELKAEDRLGKQLKSFTEWLKTMRKLPEASVEAELEKINDREIASIAAHSLDEKEVITEAMAEVLAKQGLHTQAIDMYRKLSLINPGKSAYFAAKIEALKTE
jgi:hypothetical protein